MRKRIRRFSDSEKNDIVTRYKAGELLRTIAKAHKTSVKSVSEIGMKLSGTKRLQGPQNGSPRTY
jgi:hypothetical protein